LNKNIQENNTLAKVSVVIPCFCCAKTIERTVVSIAQQTQKPAEVILIDDASYDNTLVVLQNLAKQYFGWIKVIALPENQGASNARNVGWATATQPYIAFLDADDAWHPMKIEIQYAYMSEHAEVMLCGHGHRFIKQTNAFPDWRVSESNDQRFHKWSWLLSNKFVTPSVMVRRDVHQRFSHGQRYMEDHRLWLEFVYSGLLVTKLSVELVAIYKGLFGEMGLSAQLWPMEKGELSNYRYLYDNDRINLPQWLSLSAYSLLKFARRLVIYWGWLRWKK
jgi:glycosyltransferase involved in cell wall biosynthesis